MNDPRKLTDDEVTAYIHRAEVGNSDAAKWASGKLADHIAALSAELAQVRGELEEARNRDAFLHLEGDRLWSVNGIFAQVGRLREALKQIADTDRETNEALQSVCADIALEALAGEGGT